MPYALRFLLAALAVWRLTHLFTKEDGPWEVFLRLREGIPGQLFSCFYCLSLWIAVPFVWFTGGNAVEKVVTWLALSGAAVLLEKATDQPLDIQIEQEEKREEEEPEHELLRAKRRAAGR
jgi:Protein of unknown function (DUF1360)